MSLRPDERTSRRSRSKSGTRDRSRSNVRTSKAPSPPTSAGYGDPPQAVPVKTGPPMPGSFSNSNNVTSPTYEVRTPQGAAERSTYFPQTAAAAAPSRYAPAPKAQSAPSAPYPEDDGGWTMGDYSDFPPHERPGYVPPQAQFPQWPRENDDDDLAYGDSGKTERRSSRQPSYSNQPQSQYPGQRSETSSAAAYRYMPDPNDRNTQVSPHDYRYAPPPDKITYTATPQTGTRHDSYTQSTQKSTEQLARKLDRTSSYDKRDRAPSISQPQRLSVSMQQAPSSGLRMDRLSVSGSRPDFGVSDMPPPSPLLEAYHGTYQSLSPMLAMRPNNDDDLSDLELETTAPSRNKKQVVGKLERDLERSREKKRVVVYDAEADAKRIAKAFNHHKIDTDPLVDILPGLSHDQIWELRKEYKKQVKIQGKGINLPKHLKLKVTGNFGKAAYVTTLGRWESEGHWANFWYQSHGSRRELLIESLMGRSNAEIRNIKDEFKDKRYSDSLTKCMEKELKIDKFRTAILMALEERRQEEQDIYPVEYRDRDVEMLNRALTAKQGGESAMIEIIVRRSDAHLREVLKAYESVYRENFARAALKKSNNLVGEVIAHILNGVINKPARDALLIQHAIRDIAARNKDDDLRYELLISRLVRLHWDKMHLVRVKRTYVEKYGRELQQDVDDATKGDFKEFMCELAETR